MVRKRDCSGMGIRVFLGKALVSLWILGKELFSKEFSL